MRVFTTIYALISAVVLGLCLFRPYGATEFELLKAWPAVAGSSFAAFVLAAQFRPPLKYLATCATSFLVSVVVASFVSERNSVFLTDLDGLVERRYLGGHALESLEVKSITGEVFHVEGVSKSEWNLIEPGEHVMKRSRSFEMVVGNQVIGLGKSSTIRTSG